MIGLVNTQQLEGSDRANYRRTAGLSNNMVFSCNGLLNNMMYVRYTRTLYKNIEFVYMCIYSVLIRIYCMFIRFVQCNAVQYNNSTINSAFAKIIMFSFDCHRQRLHINYRGCSLQWC